MFNSLTSLFKLFATYPGPPTCPNNSFFGFIPWYHYLPTTDFKSCTIQNFSFLPGAGTRSDIPLILLAVVDDLLRVAGFIAVGFIIYGGIQYITSQGQPERTSRAQNTITDALVGLVICIGAVTIVSFLGNRLGGA